MSAKSYEQRLLPVGLVLLAFALRAWQLASVPPGWSDDELSNVFVISHKIFQGDWSVYYTDATGLEAPYHVIAGGFLRLFGLNAVGIRLFSAYLGTLTVPLTYQMGQRLFDRRVGLVASATLAVSFWSLMYSRVNLRHIALPVMALGVMYWFWRGVDKEIGDRRSESGIARISNLQSLISSLQCPFVIAGVLLGLSFYTYFASRGIPLILAAFIVYLAVVERERVRKRWRGLLVTFLLAGIIALPLVVTLQREAGADARVVEVAVPLVEAQAGNFEPLLRHVRVTLHMFHADGDDEHLYNIPHRPVFGALGALFLWAGVAIALWLAVRPIWPVIRQRRTGSKHAAVSGARRTELAAAFLLLWWAAGISPGFLSVPPASLGHTILAQPVSFILLALPLWALTRLIRQRRSHGDLPVMVGLILVASVGWRDLPDYFRHWPQQGMVRFLYHADVEEVARFVAQQEGPRDFAISGLLAGPWDRLALQVALNNARVQEAQPRWYHAQRAMFLSLSGAGVTAFSGYPRVEAAYMSLYETLGPEAGAYDLTVVQAAPPQLEDPICFENGLCLIEAQPEPSADEQRRLHLTWWVRDTPRIPETPLYSKPPPPGVYAGPRLLVFAQYWGNDGQFVDGDDGFWVDAATLRIDDVFRQQHFLPAGNGEEAGFLLVGLYDPMTGQRILTEDGRDAVRIELNRLGGQ